MSRANQKEVAAHVLRWVDGLNTELRNAFAAGLKVHIDTDYSWPTEESSRNSKPLVFLNYKAESGDILAQNVNPKYVKAPWEICEHRFGQVIVWQGDIFQADVYEECSKCGTKRFYIYPTELSKNKETE